MSKLYVAIFVKTREEIAEVYELIMDDMSSLFYPDCYRCDKRQNIIIIETAMHNITIELLDEPNRLLGRRANLVILKDFMPESEATYSDFYEPMTSIGGYMIEYNVFAKHYDGRNRGYMRYDGLVNYHDYKMSQYSIEHSIGMHK